MLHFLPTPLRGALAASALVTNTLVVFPPVLVLGVTKLALPTEPLRVACSKLLISIASAWVSVNSGILNVVNDIEWQVEGGENLDPSSWYFVTCNHQSWTDIPVMQHVLNGKIPFLKFFLKQELIWVPLMGIAWWALDFPFMKRFSSEYLRKHPEMKGKDLETTRIACEKFKYTPVTVFNFLEGTRLTAQKHQQQQSPYKHLLKPKAGGVGFVLGAMGEQMHTMLDISIVYPNNNNSFWALISGQIKTIKVHIKTIPLPPEYLGKDYMNDSVFSDSFKQWISDLWAAKDQRIEQMKQQLSVQK